MLLCKCKCNRCGKVAESTPGRVHKPSGPGKCLGTWKVLDAVAAEEWAREIAFINSVCLERRRITAIRVEEELRMKEAIEEEKRQKQHKLSRQYQY